MQIIKKRDDYIEIGYHKSTIFKVTKYYEIFRGNIHDDENQWNEHIHHELTSELLSIANKHFENNKIYR